MTYTTVSLLKNFDKLKLFLNQLPRQVDITCLSDTRLTSDKIAMANLDGYNTIFSVVIPLLVRVVQECMFPSA